MAHARVFVPLSKLEQWLSDGRAQIDGDTLTLGGQRFEAISALHFVAEIAEGTDEHGLVGRVKSRALVEQLGAELSGDAVLLGDSAYQVVEGYTLVPSASDPALTYPRIVQLFTSQP